MVKYLNAELYKVTHRRAYLYGFLAVVCGGIAAFLLFLRLNAGPGATFEVFVGALPLVLSMGLYLAMLVCDMVFSDQYKHNTLKNEVSYGLPRHRVYLGKLAVAALTAAALCAVILGVYLLLSRLLFPVGAPEDLDAAWRTLGQTLLMALPLWLGGLGLIHLLFFWMKGSTPAAVVYILLLSGVGMVLDILDLALPKLHEVVSAIQYWLLSNPFSQLTATGSADIAHGWIVGMAWLIVSTVIGLSVFRKREIS